MKLPQALLRAPARLPVWTARSVRMKGEQQMVEEQQKKRGMENTGEENRGNIGETGKTGQTGQTGQQDMNLERKGGENIGGTEHVAEKKTEGRTENR